jgi:hypothetical protein
VISWNHCKELRLSKLGWIIHTTHIGELPHGHF